MARNFTHLHVHTGYSLLDGAAKVEPLVKEVAESGQTAISSTDHGNLYAIPEMARLCAKYGIQYIPGMEAYQARHSISERPQTKRNSGDDSDTGKLYHHLTLLAMDYAGYQNLIKLSSRAFLEGYYYKPRVDWDILSQHSEGLIATTSCLGGIVLQELMKGNYAAAREAAGNYKDIFGDGLYVEVQDHGIPEQHKTNFQLVQLAKEMGLKLVATNDLHYINKEDSHSHDILLCCQTNTTVANPDRFQFTSDQHYLKTASEMYALFSDPMFAGACENTMEIADRCIYVPTFTSDKFHLPSFPYDEDLFDSEMDYLRDLTFSMAKDRYGVNLPENVVQRINYELDVIGSMGFSSYFLINWDLMRFAQEQGIKTGFARGSAGGCIVAYCLRITHIDPIKYNLYFERFLNPSRISMPDIDSDFDTRYRDRMINYCAEKYGKENVTQIITITRLAAKSAIKDVTRALGHEISLGNEIAGKLPQPLMGKETPLHAALSPVPPDKYKRTWPQAKALRELYAQNETVREICDHALTLEGVAKTTGVHAAAVIIADKPITEYLPEQITQDKNEDSKKEKVKTTQFTMGVVEDLGLLKMDFLGLRNIDIVDMTQKMLEERGIEFDMYDIPLDDAKTYQLLQKGLGVGVFQVESRQMQELMIAVKPENINDIAAIVALYRPGPMGMGMHTHYANRKHGREPIEYIHDDAKEILDVTYGVMTYQEQMMEIGQKFAGYTMAQGDNLRKITGKKLVDKMKEEKDNFINGCLNNGYSLEVGKHWWELIEPFADYSFNKSHAVGYGCFTYLTAYLKANYPTEYMCALLTSVKNKLEKAGVYISESKRIGVTVCPVDINISQVDFAPQGDKILFALSAIRNVGDEISQLIIDERERNGDYSSFYNFCDRVPTPVLKTNVVASLIKAGAFDQFHSRKGLVMTYEAILADLKPTKKKKDKGLVAIPLFAELEIDSGHIDIPNETFTDKETLSLEREFIGCYVTKHPLDPYVDSWNQISSTSIADVLEGNAKSTFTVAGTITSFNEKITKKGDKMCILTLSDFTDSIEVVVFPKTYNQIVVSLDEVVKVTGKVNDNNDSPSIIALRVETIENRTYSVQKNTKPLLLSLSSEQLSPLNISKLKKLLVKFPGSRGVIIKVVDSQQKVDLGGDFTVSNSPVLLSEIRKIFKSKEIFG